VPNFLTVRPTHTDSGWRIVSLHLDCMGIIDKQSTIDAEAGQSDSYQCKDVIP